jgi:hypothetical protein
MICKWIQTATLVRRSRARQVCARAIRGTAGSAAALAAKGKTVRRGTFMASPLRVDIIPISASLKGAAAAPASFMRPGRPKIPAPSYVRGGQPQGYARTSAEKIIEISGQISAECLADHSYIDMTGFFRRSNVKAHVTSAA